MKNSSKTPSGVRVDPRCILIALVMALTGPAWAQPVSWLTNGDGLWTDAANWSSFPLLPGLADDVVIDRRGEPGRPGSGWLVTLSGNSTQLIGNLLLEERLTLSSSISLVLGGTLTANNSLLLSSSTTIFGGLITSTGSGNFTASGGRLIGVTLGTDMLVTSPLTIENGLTLTQQGAVLSNSTLAFAAGTQSVQGTGQIVLGTTGTSTRPVSAGANAHVTFGPNIVLRTGTSSGQVSGPASSSFTNLGTISAQTQGRTLSLGTGGTTFINLGVLEAVNGANMTLSGPWSNANGTILTGEATLNLGGDFSTSALGTIVRNGGIINLTGTLDNIGTVLDLQTTTGALNLLGVINGGTITSTGPAALTASGGRLIGVTLGTDMLVTSPLTIENGLTLTQQGAVLSNSTLAFAAGTQSVQGTGQIVFGTTGTSTRPVSAGANAHVTFGPNIVLRTGTSSGQVSGPASSSFTNLGTISAQTQGRTLSLGTGGTAFNNLGLVKTEDGATLRLVSNGGTLTNLGEGILTGGTWRVGTNSTIDFGTASIVTNAADIVLDGPGSSFNALNSLQRNEGRLEVRGGRVFTAADGLEFASGGTLVVTPTDPDGGAWVTPLVVPGAATLGGTLVVEPLDGFAPGLGEGFEVLAAGSIDGRFDDLVYDGPVGPGQVGRLFYFGDSVVFAVVCRTDLAAPIGVLDVTDVFSFLNLYQGGDAAADLAAPAGVFNVFDIFAFIRDFQLGCS